MFDAWAVAGEIGAIVGAVGGVLGGLGAVGAWVYAVRAGRRADAATRQAVDAQREAASAGREAAEALRRQADAYERIVALEERRARPNPVRFRVDGFGPARHLVNVGGLLAVGVDVEIDSGNSTFVDAVTELPVDMHPGDRIELAVWRGGTPGAARMVVTWTNTDGTECEQTIAIS